MFDVVFLSRLQFALNITYHYLFPPMTIGLGWILIVIEGMYLKTKDVKYKHMVIFWTKIFSLFFAMGVATGFVQAFSFGNNWSQFSKFTGNIFGALLAAEGIFAFFLEAGFLGVMLFGWDKVKPWFHYLATILVSLGATFSAIWIVMANSWMQTPAGYKIIGEGIFQRAVITNLWEIYLNPSFASRVIHVLLGCGILAIFLLLSVSAYYLLKRMHVEFARFTMKFSLYAALLFLILQLISGDQSSGVVAKHQPLKLAAMEGVFETEPGTPFSVIGWVDMKNEKVHGIFIPGLLSLLTFRNLHEAVQGLNEFPRENWPWVPGVFYSFKTMIYSWGAMMLYAITGLILMRKNRIEKHRWFLWLAVFSILFPYLANTAGWFTAELGRQPWIVYNVLKTTMGHSRVLSSEQVLGSLIMFTTIYILMSSLFAFLLNHKIQHGPEQPKIQDQDVQYRDPFLLNKKPQAEK